MGIPNTRANEGSPKKWTVAALQADWGDCHSRTVRRTLRRHRAKVIRIAGRLLVPDSEKLRIEAERTTDSDGGDHE